MHKIIAAAASLAAICFATTAHAQLVPYKTSMPNRHPSMSLLGSSQPISDAHAACLKPVNAALFSGLYLLTTLKPVGAVYPTRPDPNFKATEALIAELRYLVEKTDWAARPAGAMRSERNASVTRQKAAHELLVLVTLAHAENIAASINVQRRMDNLGKPGGEPEAARPQLETLAKNLENDIDELEDEALKQAAMANLFDATVQYYDCELAPPAERK
jgi:hypothetical protein